MAELISIVDAQAKNRIMSGRRDWDSPVTVSQNLAEGDVVRPGKYMLCKVVTVLQENENIEVAPVYEDKDGNTKTSDKPLSRTMVVFCHEGDDSVKRNSAQAARLNWLRRALALANIDFTVDAKAKSFTLAGGFRVVNVPQYTNNEWSSNAYVVKPLEEPDAKPTDLDIPISSK